MWRALRNTIERFTASAAPPKVRYEKELTSAIEQLQAAKPSTNRMGSVVEALAKPREELRRLPSSELRKLAHHSYFGIGTPQNIDRASELWVEAAMKGCTDSAYSVAMCTLQGVGRIEKDEERATMILEGLAKHGHPWAQFALATILTREHNTPDGTPEELTRAFTLYKAAADAGVAPALKNVSNALELGIGVPKNLRAAIEYLQKGAIAGDPTAQIALGRRLTMGDGVEKDEVRGFGLFQKAAEAGRPAAIFNVGCAYLSAIGTEKNLELAREHFLRAAELGFFPAQLNLANIYAQGLGVEQDMTQALKWYSAASGKEASTPEELIENAKEALALADGEDDNPADQLGFSQAPVSGVDRTGKAVLSKDVVE